MGIIRLFKFFRYNKAKKDTKYAIRSTLLRILGIDGQLTALQYFLNEFHSTSDLGPTKDEDLRIMQKCDVLLLEVFHKFCIKHDLVYWLDHGTLLGAVRHKGFIPWDDDMDIAMPRNDYQSFYELAVSELIPLGFEVKEMASGSSTGFSYMHKKTGLWLDVFPVDTLQTSLTLDDAEPLIVKGIDNFRRHYKGTENANDLAEKREKYINQKLQKGHNVILYHGPEFAYPRKPIHKFEDVYPIKESIFEDKLFHVPSDADTYLKRIYGNGYMMFPKDGVLHHGDLLMRPPLSRWASLNGINMNDIYKTLQKIISDNF